MVREEFPDVQVIARETNIGAPAWNDGFRVARGDYVLILGGQIVATGGFLLHYNKPFADLYMEVEQNYRRKGAGSFLIQEIIKQSYVQGRVPAARCNISNIASRATLTKAGMRTCGFMLVGDVRNSC